MIFRGSGNRASFFLIFSFERSEKLLSVCEARDRNRVFYEERSVNLCLLYIFLLAVLLLEFPLFYMVISISLLEKETNGLT